MFLGMIALVTINVPIAVALGVIALIAMVVTSGRRGDPQRRTGALHRAPPPSR